MSTASGVSSPVLSGVSSPVLSGVFSGINGIWDAEVRPAIIDLLNASVTRASTRTVLGYQSDDALYGADAFVEFTSLAAGVTKTGTTEYTYNTTGSTFSQQPTGITGGLIYEVDFTISGYIGTGAVRIECANGVGTYRTANGNYVEELSPTINSGINIRTGSVAFVGVVTINSIKPVTQPSLLTVPIDTPAMQGYRQLADNSWSAVDINGIALPDPKGLSVADAGENLAWPSADFAAWILKMLVTRDAGIGPFGTTTADRLLNVVTREKSVYKLAAHTIGTDLVLAVYVKSNTATDEKFKLFGDSAIATSGELTATQEWQRFEFTFNPTVTGLRTYGIITSTAAGNLTDILAEAVDLTVGTVAGPHIPTTTAAATRDADIVTVPTPDVLTAESGAIEMVLTPDEAGQAFKYLWTLYTDSNNRLSCTTNGTGTTIQIIKSVGGFIAAPAIAYTTLPNTKLRCQVYWDDVLGLGIRAADEDADISLISFVTYADTTPILIPSTVGICNQDGVGQLKVSNIQPIKCYASKQAAGW